MSGVDPSYGAGTTTPRCYRHPDRETYIRCQRCGRSICPNCMLQASVGFQCPECVREGASQSRQARTSFGGRLTGRATALTMGLIGINAVVFVIALATNADAPPNQYGDFTENLIMLSDGSPFGLDGVAQGGYWRLVTSTFLHVQVFHILMNMVGLWIFGSFLESQLGRWRFLGLYLLTGLAGSVVVYWFAAPFSASLGASGSIFGLFGAALIILVKQRRDVSQLLMLLALNLLITFTVPDISWQAHIGGLVVGLGMGAGFAYAPRAQRTVLHAGLMVAVFALCAVLIALRTTALTT